MLRPPVSQGGESGSRFTLSCGFVLSSCGWTLYDSDTVAWCCQFWKFFRYFSPPLCLISSWDPIYSLIPLGCPLNILSWPTFQFTNSLLTFPQILLKSPTEFLIWVSVPFCSRTSLWFVLESFQFFNSSLTPFNIWIIADNIFLWITCFYCPLFFCNVCYYFWLGARHCIRK